MADYYNQKGIGHSSENLSNEVKSIDQELEELIKKQSAKIKVIGVGGGGNNSLSRMREIGIRGGELIAMNTDAQDLLYTNADYKILIGKELTQGLGAGSNPRIGEESAKESESEIRKKIIGCDMVFITCGLGGGTGTGAAPVIAGVAKKQNILTIGVVTLPFTVEGKKRIENAMDGLERLESVVDTLIVIPNDKLLELAPDLPLHTAFKIADEILTNAVKGITELVTTSGLVNLDLADIRSVMTNGGVSLIGMGESDTSDRASEAVEKAINNPLLDVDISDATGALINVIGGNDMSLDECKLIVETVGDKLNSDAKIIWGAQISPDMDKSIRVLLIVTGVKSSQILGHGETSESRRHTEIEEELGIEFFE
ncbi:cell division protein FtsZ [Candidatus Pacearchaeota archaeon CG10_big_fil_rev_8_21_14_0_10_34_12]|nr:MAG: cell division protein FtsZ [Candidatus Pacearchaeota archaeon CG10_big_fil_rev_8_21_14_0_10_34_12]